MPLEAAVQEGTFLELTVLSFSFLSVRKLYLLGAREVAQQSRALITLAEVDF